VVFKENPNTVPFKKQRKNSKTQHLKQPRQQLWGNNTTIVELVYEKRRKKKV
jgi:hypothetical protein